MPDKVVSDKFVHYLDSHRRKKVAPLLDKVMDDLSVEHADLIDDRARKVAERALLNLMRQGERNPSLLALYARSRASYFIRHGV